MFLFVIIPEEITFLRKCFARFYEHPDFKGKSQLFIHSNDAKITLKKTLPTQFVSNSPNGSYFNSLRSGMKLQESQIAN